MIKSQMFIASALFVGVAIGYFVKPQENPPPPAPVAVQAKMPLPDKGSEATIAALRARVAELEKRISEQPEAEVAVQQAAAVPQPPPGPQDWRKRFEEMKQNDPERYAQMTNRMAQFRARRLEHAQSRLDFLSSIDTSRMSASARKTHEQLQAMIERREEIESRLHQGDLADGDRRLLFEEMREADRELRRLNRAERDNLLNAAARELGLAKEEAAEMTDAVKSIIEATDSPGFFPPRGPRRR